MKKVYLERRYVNCTFESTELDLNDIDIFIRSELQRYDIYESSTSTSQKNSISPPEIKAVNTSIVSSSLEDVTDNTQTYFSYNTSYVSSTHPCDLFSYPQQATHINNQNTWSTSLSAATSAPYSGTEKNSQKNKKSLSDVVSQVSSASTVMKPSEFTSTFFTLIS